MSDIGNALKIFDATFSERSRVSVEEARRATKRALEHISEAQDEAIFSAYLGIGVLYIMLRAAKLKLGQERARTLMIELDTAFPGLAARAALRKELAT